MHNSRHNHIIDGCFFVINKKAAALTLFQIQCLNLWWSQHSVVYSDSSHPVLLCPCFLILHIICIVIKWIVFILIWSYRLQNYTKVSKTPKHTVIIIILSFTKLKSYLCPQLIVHSISVTLFIFLFKLSFTYIILLMCLYFNYLVYVVLLSISTLTLHNLHK